MTTKEMKFKYLCLRRKGGLGTNFMMVFLLVLWLLEIRVAFWILFGVLILGLCFYGRDVVKREKDLGLDL